MQTLQTLINTAAITLIAAFSIFAQRPDFNRAQTFDAQHYAIKTSFDRANKKITGETTVTLKPLKANFRTVELDAVGLNFTSIKLAAMELKFTTGKDKVKIQLDKAYTPDDTITLNLKYTASPKKGIYFVPAETNRSIGLHSAQVWTQGQPDEARHWFPSFDFPSDKATTEQYITAQKGETVIANGEMIRKQENSDGTVTWHYKMNVPHSTYLVSFVVGEYKRIDDKYRNTPLGIYVYPGKEHLASKAFGQTKRMMQIFESLTGVPYPFNKYDQTIVAKFDSAGMENITATTFSDQFVYLADMQFGDSLVIETAAHELAHSWFGNLVTCHNWAELWLNEGFAQFMEAAYLEKENNRNAYIQKIRLDANMFLANDPVNEDRHALFNHRAGDLKKLFRNTAITYHKASAVLHTLREQVGDTAFWRGINLYLTRHKFSNVETADLQKAMEETSNQDLAWFFDQWVYHGGAPNLDITHTYDATTKTVTITIDQTQKADALTPAVFRLPLEITLETPDGPVNQTIELKKSIETITVKTESPPTRLILDRNEKLPIKRMKIRDLIAQ